MKLAEFEQFQTIIIFIKCGVNWSFRFCFIDSRKWPFLQQLCTTVQLLDKIYFISVVLTIVTSYPGNLAGNWQQNKMPFQVPAAFHWVRSETDSTYYLCFQQNAKIKWCKYNGRKPLILYRPVNYHSAEVSKRSFTLGPYSGIQIPLCSLSTLVFKWATVTFHMSDKYYTEKYSTDWEVSLTSHWTTHCNYLTSNLTVWPY